ncbi:MAG TPA: hypothetical protein DCP62_00175 [Erysipelotrichaceae bacterium]|nr:hypothetical protein [Erysipelotrichaceae bacterium]
MKNKFIKLANDETIEMNVNFLTLKSMGDQGLFTADFASENIKDRIDIAAKLIYALMYSNGKKVTMEDALRLVPIGEEDTLMELIEEFQLRMEAFQKKTASREQLKAQLMK